MSGTLPPMWAHQSLGVKRALEEGDFAYFMEQGTGKSRTLIETLRYHFNNQKGLIATLILCPAIVVHNWPDEFAKYAPKIDPNKIIKLTGPGPKRLKALTKAIEKHGRNIIVVTNYEAIVSVKGMFEALTEWSPDFIGFDESQRLKTHNSQRTKKAIALADRAVRRFLLSGTPILNSPMDIWSQFRCLDGGATFGKSFFYFRNKYFYDKNAGMPKDRHFPDFVIREEAMVDIHNLIQKKALIVKKSECLDLPPLVKKVVHVDLSPEQARTYKEMKEEFITFLNDQACTAQMAITKAMRLQQIISGHIPLYDDDLNEQVVEEFTNTPRERALEELLTDILEDPSHKVLVWACWRPNYKVVRRVCEKLGVKYVEVHGDVSSSQKAQNIKDFQNDPSVRVFLGHPGSGGIGINLVEAGYSIYYSRGYKLEDYLQSEARNYRGGSEIHDSVTHYDIVAHDTIDQEIQQALANKFEIGEALLRSIKNKL